MGARIEMINKIKNFKKASDGVKASVVYTLSSLFTRELAIITVPVITRLICSEEIGIVNLYNSWFAMISVVTTLSLTSGGFQLAMKEFRNERNQYVSSVLTLTSAMAGLTFLIYLIKPSFWNNITGLPTGLMLLLLVDLLFSPAQSFWLSRQRYEYKYKAVAAVSFLSALAASVLSVIVLIILGLKYMMGSVEEKAEYKKSFMPYIIGAALVFAASTIAGIVYNIAGSI